MPNPSLAAAALAIAALLTSAALAEEAAPAAAAPLVPPEVKIQLTVPSGFDPKADRNKLLYAEFLASKKLTDSFRAGLVEQGYRLAATREEAAVVYEVDGAFQALRPATQRTAEIRAGEYAENPDELKTVSGRGASVMVSVNPLITIIGTILSNVGDGTGARDAINAGAVGDADGKCLAKCEGWVYRQRAVVNLKRSEGAASMHVLAVSSVEARELVPAALLQRCAAELTAATGLPPIEGFGRKD
ncbi:MAG: hypothetical protein ACK5TK_03480 [Betaproteobacteria bacterium]